MGLLKIGGVASGLDTEGLIKTLMSLEQRPVTALKTKRDNLTNESSAWRDLNQRLLTLQKRVEEIKGLPASAWTAMKSSVSDTNIVSATTTESTATAGTYTVEVVKLATASLWQSGPMAVAVDDPNKDLNISGTIRVASGPTAGKTFAVAATDSLNDIAATINANSETLGFTASVVQVNPGDYRLVLKGKDGGSNDFHLEDDVDSTAAAALKLTASDATKVATAADGEMKVNGITISTGNNEVKDAVSGVTLKMSKVGSAVVTVARDYSKVVDAVKKMVDQYNSVVDLVEQQTAYDSKTKQAGTLFGESRVRDIQDSLRNKLFDPVKGLPDEVKSLGIVGVASEGFKAGEKASKKLTFSQEKFTKALEANPNGLREMFIREDAENPGMATRMVAYLDNYTRTDGILPGQVKAIDKGVELLKQRITRFEEQILPKREAALRKQFVNLEKSMSLYQNQGNWLSSQIKSLPKPEA